MKFSEGPIFLGGMNGSGTTMLLDCLNNHSMIYGFKKETKVIPYEISNAAKFGNLENDENFRQLWEHLCGLFPFQRVNDNKPLPVPEEWVTVERNAAAIFNHIFLTFAASEGKQRWCEKSPRNILNITLLAEAFPQAKFIHVIRDGRDCAASFHRRWNYQPERSVQRWKKIIRQGRQQGVQIGKDRYLEVFYEDITQKPEENIKKITDFLGIPFEKNIIVPSRVRKMTGSNATKISVNKRNYESYFSPKQLNKLEKIGGKMLNDLGYYTSVPDGDQQLPKFQDKFYKWKEMLWITFFELQRKFRKKGDHPWRIVFARLNNSLKQNAMNKAKE